MEFEFGICPDSICQRSYVVSIYETSTENNSMARNTNNYQLVSLVTTDVRGETRINRTVEINFNTDEDGFYLAITDETTCIVVFHVVVFYNVCPGVIEDSVMRPETVAPPTRIVSQPLEVTGQCVAGTTPENEETARLYCTQGGIWST